MFNSIFRRFLQQRETATLDRTIYNSEKKASNGEILMIKVDAGTGNIGDKNVVQSIITSDNDNKD